MPHTADLRIEAWAPTLEGCVVETVRAMVAAFADLSGAAPAGTRVIDSAAGDAEGHVLNVLEEVIYLMDTAGELPRDVVVRRTPGGLRAECAMAGVADAVLIGAVPKAVSYHELSMTGRDDGWHGSVTLDV
ncbi:hypothetical protein GCM10023085_15750 [Actinomadura viridis]|uniref:SHS2 domain-containing protein n=1 Tax=Actinomadura viridis TaxID=58110 RepID=A0A931DSG9_9ACTN|nr:archease [Actinomadura viridis]MBG6093943.1 SHS2 domain-containing protein [Actinomadura viridis]